MLDESATKLGAVETWQHARICANLFRRHRDRIEGVLVSLPNFGDEKGVADTLKLAALDVPVLVQAYPDDLQQLNVERRRDGFCGKISVCNNLRQDGIPFTLTDRHTRSIPNFGVVPSRPRPLPRGVPGRPRPTGRRASVPSAPARTPSIPRATARSLLEASGISVSTMDLSEVLE